MHAPVIILGAGIGGLYTAHLLQRDGVAAQVVEARPRVGGRILGVDAGDGTHRYDLGPSWIWPSMNPLATALVDQLGLRLYPQHTRGGSLFEPPQGPVQKMPHTWNTEPPSMRVVGGMSALVQALHATLPAGAVRLGQSAVKLERSSDGVTVRLAGGECIEAGTVITTLPPRLLADSVRLVPAPDETWWSRRRATPTWMAGQAKLVAAYDSAFWRENGLSGMAMSQRGPLVEIHDASDADGAHAALFGFVGYPAPARRQMGRDALIDAAIGQLERLFGPAARQPTAVHLQDWAEETATATADDATPVNAHPDYRPPVVPASWQDRLRLAGSECSPGYGGYIEGALEAAHGATVR
jgi:monoamine oxidase